jgi:hypothetical protein
MTTCIKFRRSSAARSPWTPEECGRFAASRDLALLAALADNRRLLKLARRLQFLPQAQHPGVVHGGVAGAAGAAPAGNGILARSSAVVAHGGSACPAGAQAVDQSPHAAAAAGANSMQDGAVRQAAATRRPRKRSEAKIAERKAKFDEKWRVRRLASTAASLAEAAAVTQPLGNGGLPTRQAASAALSVHVPDPYVRQWTDAGGRLQSQMYGRCGGCGGACVLDFREEGGRGWLCEECWAAGSVFG